MITLPLLRKSAAILAIALSAFSSQARAEDAPQNKKCPIMTEDDVEDHHNVEFKGQKIALCCGKCEKLWKGNDKAAAYFVKVATELGLLPQFKGKEKELGLDKIELLPQRYCPIHQKTLISPESPTVEYKGVKVYVYNAKTVETWNKDPEGCAKKAIAAGLLPQVEKK